MQARPNLAGRPSFSALTFWALIGFLTAPLACAQELAPRAYLITPNVLAVGSIALPMGSWEKLLVKL